MDQLVETSRLGQNDRHHHLAAAEVRPQADLARHVREPAVQRDGAVPRITAEQLDIAT